MRRAIRRILAERRSIAAVEFALLAPVMLVLAGGIVEVGALLRAYAAVNRFTMQYALSWADCNDTSAGACQTELSSYTSAAAIGNVVPQLTASQMTLNMFQVKMSGSTPTVVYSYPASASLSAAQTSAAQGAVPSGQTGIVVSASYQYSLLVFSTVMAPIIGSSFTIAYTVAQLKS